MLMKKDSEIRQLKAEMPLTPSGKPVDRYGTQIHAVVVRVFWVFWGFWFFIYLPRRESF
jgi:hypothetical protein